MPQAAQHQSMGGSIPHQRQHESLLGGHIPQPAQQKIAGGPMSRPAQQRSVMGGGIPHLVQQGPLGGNMPQSVQQVMGGVVPLPVQQMPVTAHMYQPAQVMGGNIPQPAQQRQPLARVPMQPAPVDMNQPESATGPLIRQLERLMDRMVQIQPSQMDDQQMMPTQQTVDPLHFDDTPLVPIPAPPVVVQGKGDESAASDNHKAMIETLTTEVQAMKRQMVTALSSDGVAAKKKSTKYKPTRTRESSSEDDSDCDSDGSDVDTVRLCRDSPRGDSKSRGPGLPNFTGKETWKVWFNRFQEVARRSGWDDEEKLDELMPKLQGAAGEFVFAQLSQRTRQSYKRLVKELENRFRVVETAKTFGARFSARNQKPGSRLRTLPQN